MGILEKFDAVEVQQDRRISPLEKAYCEAQQAACTAAAKRMKAIADAITEAYAEQREILSPVYTTNDYADYNSYLDDSHMKADEIREHIVNRHRTYIGRIVDYFASNHRVNLDQVEIMNHLIPEAPAKPDYYYGMSDKAMEAYKERYQLYEQQYAQYEQEIFDLEIPYESIVDEIFQQLGGFSFEEQELRELKKKLWENWHSNNWRTEHQTVEDFEIKNQTLKLENGCSNDSYWRPTDEFKLHNSTKYILQAIAHYEHGDVRLATHMFGGFMDYRFDGAEGYPRSSMVEKIKCFKNGRVDIKFTDAATCNAFVDQYLRTEITEV